MSKDKKTKVTKDMVPEGFTLGLALFDAIPVIAFGITLVTLSFLPRSYMMLFGAILVFFAGASKVIWKLIVVLKKKNIWFFFVQMRYLMPVGMIILIIGLILSMKNVDTLVLRYALMDHPFCGILIIIGIVGMILMGVFAFILDGSKAKANWIEQITNAVAQVCICIGVVYMVLYYHGTILM